MTDWTEIRAICNAATDGPWRIEPVLGCKRIQAGKAGVHKQAQWKTEVACTPGLADEEQDNANATFIATARTALPEALDEIERLEKEVEALKHDLGRTYSGWCDEINSPRLQALEDVARAAGSLYRRFEETRIGGSEWSEDANIFGEWDCLDDALTSWRALSRLEKESVEAILNADGEQLRKEIEDAGDDPDAMIAETEAAIAQALGKSE